MSNRRRGKIAQLPFATRTRVNTMLRDGVPYAEIILFLGSRAGDSAGDPVNPDLVGVNEQNLTNWFRGEDGESGYQDWLREQERADDMRFKREFALEIVKQNEGSKIQEATLQLAASQLYDVLADFEIAPLKELLKEKPENYAKIVNSIAKLSKEALGYEKFRNQVRDALTSPEMQKLRDPSAPLTDAQRAAIVAKVDEIMGLK